VLLRADDRKAERCAKSADRPLSEQVMVSAPPSAGTDQDGNEAPDFRRTTQRLSAKRPSLPVVTFGGDGAGAPRAPRRRRPHPLRRTAPRPDAPRPRARRADRRVLELPAEPHPRGLAVLVDSRERYPYGFAGRQVESQRVALPAGDYAVAHGEEMIATVERKTFENLVTSLSDGTLAFQMQRLGEVARAAVVVEGHYSALFKLEHVPSAFIADGLARLQVRYPEIPVVFADSRKFAEKWTYRFLAAALSDAMSGDSVAGEGNRGFGPLQGSLRESAQDPAISRGGELWACLDWS
jgi:hypothetical protein